jgi:raffinose/stachyose/melibiose transport system substrate-binding protein
MRAPRWIEGRTRGLVAVAVLLGSLTGGSLLAAAAVSKAARPAATARYASGTYQLLSFFPQKNYDTWLRDQIKKFESTHSGVSIKVQYTDPTHIIQKIKTGVASGQAPDVATQLPGSAQLDLWKAGRLLDYTPYINADKQWQGWITGWSKVPPSQYRSGSHVFAANVSLGPMLIWYWKDMVAKAGFKTFPQTIPELLKMAAAMKAKNIPTMALGLNSQALFNFDYTWYTLESNYDRGDVKGRLADQGKYPWTASVFQKTAALFKQLYDGGVFYNGAIQKNYDPDTKVDLGAKRASMGWPLGPWMDGYYPDNTISNVGVALFPKLNASLPWTLTGSNDLEFIIPTVTSAQKDPAHKQTMIAFVKQLNSPSSQVDLWQQGIFPIMASVSSKPSPNKWAPVLKAQIQTAQRTRYTVDENTYSPNTDAALTNGMQAVLLGQSSIPQMLAKVQAANKKDHPCAPKCK